ncbi:Acetylornithine deacetylase/Succinyl-diaminopimelate desuccinylase [Quadrisphaera granulorum]|uniref:Acetylornithine deacetylase/succinyl-diaminopimelate desuccinylase-like protein n=1 Tax=Quadrisphaera granulorum TaxID=317664 RepID=A0A316A5E8_9ACTN|nr:M20/M25/M40 family metallo-hydrolase [Quadrisphaera granulorum]PWJ53136.1 acetylornithine deacetylase/succinyl-diaminopimelate desuccinylase-like protein [Quadrisphaera granulorum]SZE97068.1 Acetylornithine deacetylase/Succinyl-diaminopimelate desuccinylase [Quadrisphaera granulorum]
MSAVPQHSSSTTRQHDPQPDPQREVVDICRDLLRLDTTNPGDGSGPGERAAAELVAELLAEVGLEPQIFESEPGRASVVVRVEGDPAGTAERGALLLHGHLDVVPARAQDWSVHPFSGEITTATTADPETPEQEFLWGRGAVDMKDMDAMLLAVVRDRVRRGERPPRDLVLAFMADEEAGGVQGARWLVDHHPGLFEGVTAAVSEVGGFSTTIGGAGGTAGQRAYLLQTAEKGIAWLRLVAHGRAGHGSQVNTDNAVTRLCEAVARIGAHPWPIDVTPTVRRFLDGVTDITGVEFDVDDPASHHRLLDQLGTTARWVGATLRDTANPTVLEAGYKHNVIPGSATALLDCRFLPGHEERLVETIRELAGEGVEVQDVHRDVALETDFEVPLVDRMVEALLAEDPTARVLPYCLSGGTDNKSFSRLGIPGYGFAPLRLPAGLDFAGLFHGVDERVPLDALRFGTRVLQRFIAAS